MKALHMHYSTHLLLYRFPYSFLIKRQIGRSCEDEIFACNSFRDKFRLCVSQKNSLDFVFKPKKF